MGLHMLDLAAEYLTDSDVSLLLWETAASQRLLHRAAALGVRTVGLPRPRDPAFAEVIVDHLRAHPAEVFHVHVGTGRENFDGARAARRAGVPAVVQTQHLPWLLRHTSKRLALFRGLRQVDSVIAVSEGVRRTYERIGVPAERLTTVPNGIRARGRGLGRGPARAALGLEADQVVVMTVGRLTVMKGQRYLLEAVPHLVTRFPRLAVVVIGHGHLRQELAARARALGVEPYVSLPGHRTDARLLLDAADVFVLPSRHEGMPLAALEAMDAGLPVVATRSIGTDEVLADGTTGLLVPPEDPPALAQALHRVLSDPSLGARYGRAGRARYLAHFTSQRMAAETKAVYERALRAR